MFEKERLLDDSTVVEGNGALFSSKLKAGVSGSANSGLLEDRRPCAAVVVVFVIASLCVWVGLEDTESAESSD